VALVGRVVALPAPAPAGVEAVTVASCGIAQWRVRSVRSEVSVWPFKFVDSVSFWVFPRIPGDWKCCALIGRDAVPDQIPGIMFILFTVIPTGTQLGLADCENIRPTAYPKRRRGVSCVPGISYEAGTAKIYHWRFARVTYFERCFSWNVKPKSGLIAVDPRSVDRKLRDAKAHLPRVFLTRRRRDSGRGERRRGVIDHGGHGERHSVARFRVHLPFPSCKLRVAAESRDGVASTKTKTYLLIPKLCVSSRDSYQRSDTVPINGFG
jgi:hypothetical protein